MEGRLRGGFVLLASGLVAAASDGARDSEDLLDQVAPLTLDELVEQVHFEIFVMEAHDQQVGGSGATETEMGVSEDPNDRVLRAAQNVVFGWPFTDATPVPFRTPGRVAKTFPLEFPMGIADLYDKNERMCKRVAGKWVQHLFRYRTGQFVNAKRDYRFV